MGRTPARRVGSQPTIQLAADRLPIADIRAAAVLRAYGRPVGLSDEAILERLPALNLARAG